CLRRCGFFRVPISVHLWLVCHLLSLLPLLRSTTFLQKMLASREIYRLSSPDVPNERYRFAAAAAAAAADLSPSSTTTQYYLIHSPRLGLFNPIQILGLKLS
ncbi:unnamed protein product, partial [Musa hybrid cultivar]